MRRTKEQIASDLRLLNLSIPEADAYRYETTAQGSAHDDGVEDCLHQVVEPLLKRIQELEGTLPK